MKCPKCGLLMEEGTMYTQKYPFWTQQELRFFHSPTDMVELGPPGDDTTSMFTRDPFSGISPRYALPGVWPGHISM